jgi:hypothetical protein
MPDGNRSGSRGSELHWYECFSIIFPPKVWKQDQTQSLCSALLSPIEDLILDVCICIYLYIALEFHWSYISIM